MNEVAVANRETDMQVCTFAYGRKCFTHEHPDGAISYRYKRISPSGKYKDWRRIPNYTTSEEAAMTLVTHLIELLCTVAICKTVKGNYDVHLTQFSKTGEGRAETLPLAICRAVIDLSPIEQKI